MYLMQIIISVHNFYLGEIWNFVLILKPSVYSFLPSSVSLTPSKENHTVSYVERVLGGGALYSAV